MILSHFFFVSGRGLLPEACGQGLIRQALPEPPLPGRLPVFARPPAVQSSVPAVCCLLVACVGGVGTLPATGGLPLAPFDGLEQLLLVRVNLHGRTPHRGTASSPSGSG